MKRGVKASFFYFINMINLVEGVRVYLNSMPNYELKISCENKRCIWNVVYVDRLIFRFNRKFIQFIIVIAVCAESRVVLVQMLQPLVLQQSFN